MVNFKQEPEGILIYLKEVMPNEIDAILEAEFNYSAVTRIRVGLLVPATPSVGTCPVAIFA